MERRSQSLRVRAWVLFEGAWLMVRVPKMFGAKICVRNAPQSPIYILQVTPSRSLRTCKEHPSPTSSHSLALGRLPPPRPNSCPPKRPRHLQHHCSPALRRP